MNINKDFPLLRPGLVSVLAHLRCADAIFPSLMFEILELFAWFDRVDDHALTCQK